MVTKKKIAIFIGRFAPFHNGHNKILQHCNQNYDETIVFVGSSNKRRTLKNPFEPNIVRNWIEKAGNETTHVVLSKDFLYNDMKWITQIEDSVYTLFNKEVCEFTIVGHNKDESSYYLKIFPNWLVDELPNFEEGLNATDIRDIMFDDKIDRQPYKNQLLSEIEGFVPQFVFEDIKTYIETEQHYEMLVEKNYFEREAKKFENYPYPDTLKFNCSDAVVVCDGNVLLIERKVAPGKGTWALPGGFVNTNETYEQCAIRELFEETNLKVPEKVLKGSCKGSKVFDHPKRNEGIPRITNAFYFVIQPDYKNGFPKLPKVKGSDDASNAKWFPIAEVRHMKLFDDHEFILDFFVNSI